MSFPKNLGRVLFGTSDEDEIEETVDILSKNPDTEKAPVAVESVKLDNTVFMTDNTIYAQGAEIEVYDIMGCRLAIGVDAVTIENANQMVFVVRTKYADGQSFVTKVANR